MPRKPTRSDNESRPTRRNLIRRVEDLDEAATADVNDPPPLTIVEALSCDPELVHGERRIFRVNGELKDARPIEEHGILLGDES